MDEIMAGQVAALHDKLDAAFREWAEECGWNVDDWKQTEGLGQDQGELLNPIGVRGSYREAAMSLQRIAEMRAVDQGTLCASFHAQTRNGDQELPSMLAFDGRPSVVIWGYWDGERVEGIVPIDHPEKPMVLTTLEGEEAGAGSWTDPLRVYSLMEFGYRLGRYEPPSAEDEEIPF